MSRTIIDVHVLQTVPPSNLNRDDTGTPKTALYGSPPRPRLQPGMEEGDPASLPGPPRPAELGVRTRRVAEMLAERITAVNASLDGEAALELAAETVSTATGSKIEAPAGRWRARRRRASRSRRRSPRT
ncbi:type I-E CRISPR-associated protein Cas7/Cse4/CasC [Streptomyces sp. NPDC058045]|uniref:type I-E CRISPR-associated protein Cas7/Cse4/CasC n=1 Tax=Streptomyces sp. NPDC058045 TaxID=3346311 RepID=UPI0036EFD2D0